MIQRLTIPGVNLPHLYICENKADIQKAQEAGLPYIKWTHGKDELIKTLLRPVLEKMFPHILWYKVLGRRRKFHTEVNVVTNVSMADEELFEPHEPTGEHIELDELDVIDTAVEPEGDDELVEYSGVTEDARYFGAMEHGNDCYEHLSIETYMGDLSSCVNMEVLQTLKLMPKFIGDILDCIKVNSVSPILWREGYTKKLGACLGNYNTAPQLKNLIILDVSGSIPRGISATMISIIDTLREQVSADLIITGSNSRFYSINDKLPDPQTIRNQFGYGNESFEFFAILNEHISNNHYGHVFSFGDNDTPAYDWSLFQVCNAKVNAVHHYHTGAHYRYNKDNEETWKTGYAKWCHLIGCQPEVEYDTSWCTVIGK